MSDPIDMAGAEGVVAPRLVGGEALVIPDVVAGELGWLDVATEEAGLEVRHRWLLTDPLDWVIPCLRC